MDKATFLKFFEEKDKLTQEELIASYTKLIGSPPYGNRTHRRVLWTAVTYALQIKELEAEGAPIPERVVRGFEKAKLCQSYEDLFRKGLVLTMAEKYPNGQITSECPAFRKGWDESVKECQDCKQVFNEEYNACMVSTLAKQRKSEQIKDKISEPKPSEPVEKGEEKDAGASTKFAGFRKGTRAAFMLQYLEVNENRAVDITEIAKYIAEKCQITEQQAFFNADSYIAEWATGAWGGAKRDFDFIITYDKHAKQVVYRKKPV